MARAGFGHVTAPVNDPTSRDLDEILGEDIVGALSQGLPIDIRRIEPRQPLEGKIGRLRSPND
jgi:hypothetical protein